jgi:transposase
MGLVEQIDKLLGTHSQEIITPGQAVKAMILNGLGFVSAPLYLFEKFFVGKATEHLLGEGAKPEHLNDDRLGRILDKLYAFGLTELFVIVALSAARRFGVNLHSLHLDSSSLHVDGDYQARWR